VLAGSVTLFFIINTAVPFFVFVKTLFIGYNLGLFDDLVESTLSASGKSKKKKDDNSGDSARGQAELGFASV
jgi:hypothetical protein